MPGERPTNTQIDKSPASLAAPPNLTDWTAERAAFSWEAARAMLDGLPGGAGLHIAHEAVRRHARGPLAGHTALVGVGAHGERRALTYEALWQATSRFANALVALGARRGDRLFVLMPRVPELTVAVMGALSAGCVVCPLFAAFGPEPIAQRLTLGSARFLVTTSALYQRKVAAARPSVPHLEHVLVLGAEGPPGTTPLDERLAAAAADFELPPTDPEQPALLHFTSGTTGRPKGALHVHGAVLHHLVSAHYALDLRAGDVFWCTADPGWVTGMSYGVVAPLALGATNLVYEGEFDPRGWLDVLAREQVTVWYTAPTAVRMMRRAGLGAAGPERLQHLRFIASVGEPLDAEAVRWGVEAFGLPIHDNWWQTETGGILIANYAAMPIRPGSMGRPLPGVEVAVVRRAGEGRVEALPPGEQGELAVRRPWPGMFRAYLNDPARYAGCFVGDWYLSGDLARMDEDGYLWFVGRADDVIKTAGHLVGPFEVERVLLSHPAVAEAGVIGRPDPVAGEVIKAFVALRPGHAPDDGLRRELLGLSRKRLGPALSPREIAFVDGLPKTRSGKILRRLLRARELGLPEGDLSTLEPEPPGAGRAS